MWNALGDCHGWAYVTTPLKSLFRSFRLFTFFSTIISDPKIRNEVTRGSDCREINEKVFMCKRKTETLLDRIKNCLFYLFLFQRVQNDDTLGGECLGILSRYTSREFPESWYMRWEQRWKCSNLKWKLNTRRCEIYSSNITRFERSRWWGLCCSRGNCWEQFLKSCESFSRRIFKFISTVFSHHKTYLSLIHFYRLVARSSA